MQLEDKTLQGEVDLLEQALHVRLKEIERRRKRAELEEMFKDLESEAVLADFRLWRQAREISVHTPDSAPQTVTVTIAAQPGAGPTASPTKLSLSFLSQ